MLKELQRELEELHYRQSEILHTRKDLIHFIMDIGYKRKTAQKLVWSHQVPEPPTYKVLVEKLLEERRNRPYTSRTPKVTNRQKQVMDLRNEGLKYREIGERLGICTNTAKILHQKGLMNESKIIKQRADSSHGENKV